MTLLNISSLRIVDQLPQSAVLLLELPETSPPNGISEPQIFFHEKSAAGQTLNFSLSSLTDVSILACYRASAICYSVNRGYFIHQDRSSRAIPIAQLQLRSVKESWQAPKLAGLQHAQIMREAQFPHPSELILHPVPCDPDAYYLDDAMLQHPNPESLDQLLHRMGFQSHPYVDISSL